MVSGLSSRVGAGAPLRPDDPEYIDALVFLMTEAELLDGDELDTWLSLLAPEVDYVMPVQTSRLREDPGAGPAGSFHIQEDRASLELRVKRLMESTAAWSANPPPRTRRFVSNVRVRRTESAELAVSSYLLLLRSRHDEEAYELMSAERKDLLARTNDRGLELRRREITIDQTRLGVAHLPIPF
jgi:3-phenylpropionate/cinnamic acid dioxygenase small subunit